jgi:hypothetical protein
MFTNNRREIMTTLEEAKIGWRGMVITYKNMQDRAHKLIYNKNAATGEVLEARGLVIQAGNIMARMAKQLEAQFPDYEFDMNGKFIRRTK